MQVVTLSNQDNLKLLQQLKSDFQRITNWNKYQSNVSTQVRKKYSGDLINTISQWGKRRFTLSFGNNTHRPSHRRCFFGIVEITDCYTIIDWR